MNLLVSITLISIATISGIALARRGGGGSRGGGSGIRWGSSSGSSSNSGGGSNWPSSGSQSSSNWPSSGSQSSSNWPSAGSQSSSNWPSFGSQSSSNWPSSGSQSSSNSHLDSPSRNYGNPSDHRDIPGGYRDGPDRPTSGSSDSSSGSIGGQRHPNGQKVDSDDFGRQGGVQKSSSNKYRFGRRFQQHDSGRRPSSDSDEPYESTTGSNSESLDMPLSIYDMFPMCKSFVDALSIKEEELMQNGQIDSKNCQEQDENVCLKSDTQKIRCEITEAPSPECTEQVAAFMRGSLCNAGHNPDDNET
ncbi:hypothetical protein CEXT_465061 [Caerostris extrusa]|uniref:Uncharacterized protein n=1 Tax=Caerostris extrusa TaxID=172846 RepID=A0AAV4YDB9_CAEEX|nr:hypothetical protein CEXT_465061 [Caerostris extrusa]